MISLPELEMTLTELPLLPRVHMGDLDLRPSSFALAPPVAFASSASSLATPRHASIRYCFDYHCQRIPFLTQAPDITELLRPITSVWWHRTRENLGLGLAACLQEKTCTGIAIICRYSQLIMTTVDVSPLSGHRAGRASTLVGSLAHPESFRHPMARTGTRQPQAKCATVWRRRYDFPARPAPSCSLRPYLMGSSLEQNEHVIPELI